MNIKLNLNEKITEEEKQEILQYEYIVKQLRENFEEILNQRSLTYEELLQNKNRGHSAEE